MKGSRCDITHKRDKVRLHSVVVDVLFPDEDAALGTGIGLIGHLLSESLEASPVILLGYENTSYFTHMNTSIRQEGHSSHFPVSIENRRQFDGSVESSRAFERKEPDLFLSGAMTLMIRVDRLGRRHEEHIVENAQT
jgi:hypothetical protein